MIPPKPFDYILVKKLGSGSWGTVYLATPKKGGENVALKIYGSQVAMYSNYIEREFVVGKKLSMCDGVVKYIDLFEVTLPAFHLSNPNSAAKTRMSPSSNILRGIVWVNILTADNKWVRDATRSVCQDHEEVMRHSSVYPRSRVCSC